MGSPLADGPTARTDVILHTPVSKPATKRRENVHEDEPDTNNIIRDDSDMEGIGVDPVIGVNWGSEDMLALQDNMRDRDTVFHTLCWPRPC